MLLTPRALIVFYWITTLFKLLVSPGPKIFALLFFQAQRFSFSRAANVDLLSNNNNTFHTTNTINAILPTCFSQPPSPSDPQLQPIIIDDCLEVLYDIVRNSVALQPNVWDPRFMTFPVWNVFGTCAVGIVPRYSTSRDIFPELLVAHVAAVVIESCVKSKASEKVGGVAKIGVRNEFEICVYGRDPSAVGVLGDVKVNGTALTKLRESQ